MLTTMAEFIEKLKTPENLRGALWLEEMETKVPQDKLQGFKKAPFDEKGVIMLGGLVMSVAQHDVSISDTPQLQGETMQAANDFLKKIHEQAAQNGLEIPLGRVHLPDFLLETLTAAGVVEVRDGLTFMTFAGLVMARQFERILRAGGNISGFPLSKGMFDGTYWHRTQLVEEAGEVPVCCGEKMVPEDEHGRFRCLSCNKIVAL